MSSTLPPAVLLRIVWVAMVASQVIVSGVFLTIAGPADLLTAPTTYVLVAAATTLPLAGLGLRRALLTNVAPANAAAASFTASIIGFALAEAGAVIAAVTYFLSQQGLFWWPPASVALVVMLLQFPRR